MLPVACVCNGWSQSCRYCGGSGWVSLGKIGGKK